LGPDPFYALKVFLLLKVFYKKEGYFKPFVVLALRCR